MNLADWSYETAIEFLGDLHARWRHSEAVGNRASELVRLVEAGDREQLIAAAYLHDIGYAPQLRETGFHPIDGATFLREQGQERVAGLVAHHSFSRIEADLRGLGPRLDAFPDEKSKVSQILAYCDLTTDAEGNTVSIEKRLDDIANRHRSDPHVASSLPGLASRAADLAAEIEHEIAALHVSR